MTPCPYCGTTAATENTARCSHCNGLVEPLSLKATQLAMGPWFIRDKRRPFMPGVNTQTLREQVSAGRIKPDTIVRGPTTHQFWMRADHVPGLSRLLGICHSCQAEVSPDDRACGACRSDLTLPESVDTLGLSYVDPDERAKARDQVNAQRRAAAGNPQRPKPSATPAPDHTGTPALVDPDLLKPIDPPGSAGRADGDSDALPRDGAADDPAQAGHADPPGSPMDSVDLAEDLWHSTAPPARSRRRKRDTGPDPLVLGMGVMLLLVVALGMVLLVTSGGGGATADPAGDGTVADADPPALPRRTREQVATLRDLVVPRFEQVKQQAVPEELAARVRGLGELVGQARSYEAADQLSQAYEQYKRARDLIGPLEEQIAGWSEREEARESVRDLVNRVASLRAEAEQAGAPRWAQAAWDNAEFVWKRVDPLIASGDFPEADKALSEAEAMFQMSIGRATTAKSAAEARDEMLEAMASGFSEATLKQNASALFDEFQSLRAEAEQSFAAGQYDDAERAFGEATGVLNKAAQAVELSRYARYFACEAGYKAAGVMLGVASSSGIEPEALTDLSEAYRKLGLTPNPAGQLQAGEEYDFGKVSDALVHAARETITSAHGEDVQGCYLAGFHMKIIDQTLQTGAYDDDKQKRVHRSLAVIDEQATDAGWDTARLEPVIDRIRKANRSAKTGSTPDDVIDLWQKLRQPFTDRDRAVRILDPAQFPANPQDPELFPGLGT